MAVRPAGLREMACISLLAAVAAAASACGRADVLTGYVSDAHCGAFHVSADEHGPPETERECTLRCIRGGAAYVLVSNGRVYKIGNQGHPDLPVHAGRMVRMTGHIDDGLVEISRLDAQY
jgi:anaerobic selenocysteine-containing dehydrogenase